jgi:predicted nucleic acid-binding Zn ribbon protein
MSKSTKKLCPECGREVIGRVDKKFCSDYCRNAYNNKMNRNSNNLIRNTNNLLRKNYRILEEINPNQKTKTTKDILQRKGFNFNYFTSIYTTKNGKVYYFIYDQGYLELDNSYYAVVKRLGNG